MMDNKVLSPSSLDSCSDGFILTRDELRYILNPKEVYGKDFPDQTFRVLKEKEVKQFGGTRRLVLESWDKLES